MLELIADVISGRYQAPELGRPLVSGVRRLALERSLDGAEAELIAGLGLGARLAIVCDENTVDVLGRRVALALPEAELIVLDHPHADEETAAMLQDRVGFADGLIAIGSGTLNDLCKYVTHRTARHCAVFATAPSMDGYVTSVVAITRDGFKLSLPAHAPRGVFFELDTLAAAPRRMILAGFGDTICRSTAQTDWKLSHLLLDTVYAQTPYDLMAADEPLLLDAAGGLTTGDPQAMLRLVRLCILSGLGVLVTGTSHCGSMAEHQISHYMDMLATPHPGTLHGEQVGIATWTMARLQTRMLESNTAPVLRPLAPGEDFDRRLGRLAPQSRAAMAKKPVGPAETEALNTRLAERWPAIRAELRRTMLPLEIMSDAIARAGMPRSAAELGIDGGLYREAVGHALEIRDRYSFLDLAAQSGVLPGFAAAER